MKPLVLMVAIATALCIGPAVAHEPAANAAATNATPAMDPAMTQVVAVVDRFGAALKAADMASVSRLLDERVLILESGGAERSREEYLGHHAIADAAFLGGAMVSTVRRHGEVTGDTAWVGSESEITSGQGADAKTLLSSETMILKRRAGAWTIVHIHWSSRPKKAGTP